MFDINTKILSNKDLIEKSKLIKEKSDKVKKELENMENILKKKKYISKKNKYISRNYLYFFLFFSLFIVFSMFINSDKNEIYYKKNNEIKYLLPQPNKKINNKKNILKKLLKIKNIFITGFIINIYYKFKFYIDHIKKLESIIRIMNLS